MIKVNSANICGIIQHKTERRIPLSVKKEFIKQKGEKIKDIMDILWIDLKLNHHGSCYNSKRPIKIRFV